MGEPAAQAAEVTGRVRFAVEEASSEHVILCEGTPLARLPFNLPHVVLCEQSEFAAFDVLRWTLPLVVPRVGMLGLHAAAFRSAGGAVAFLGPGGAGKTTLASQVVDCSMAFAESEDCLLLGTDGLPMQGGERILRAYCALLVKRKHRVADARELAQRLEAETNAVPLRALVFVKPRQPGPGFDTAELSTDRALQELIRAGYGGRFMRRAWRTQFDVYCGLLQTARALRVKPPEGSSRQVRALPDWLREQRLL